MIDWSDDGRTDRGDTKEWKKKQLGLGEGCLPWHMYIYKQSTHKAAGEAVRARKERMKKLASDYSDD
jgi:hypothetical protein